MTVSNIKIENVREIAKLEIFSGILKNRPNILVASNGFGKTSIAAAFKSIANQTFINLPSDSRFKHDEKNKAKISLDLNGNNKTTVLCVTEAAHSNDIRKNLDIHVIGDMRRIKATTKNMGKFSSASAKQIIDPIVICKKSKKTENPYKITKIKKESKKHSGLIKNLNNSFFLSSLFIMRSTEFMEKMPVFLKDKNWKEFNLIKSKVEPHAGSDKDAIDSFLVDIKKIFDRPDFKLVFAIIQKTSGQNEVQAFISLWQLVFLVKSSLGFLKNYLDYLRYEEIKKSIQNHVYDLNTSWRAVAIKETKGDLVLEMPVPADISNGQRDILLLVAMFHVAKHQLTKSKAILVIDEVFDYLDDANLTVTQFYITELIEDYKRQGRSIYPIILTHLNPAFFKNYVFSNQNVIYLDKNQAYDSIDAMKKLISARNDKDVEKTTQDNISKYLVHYHVDAFDFSAELDKINGTRLSWGKCCKFEEFLKEEFRKYQDGQAYDPLAICTITRRSVEALAYRQIQNQTEANDFFKVHKTSSKLDWATQRGATIPETHYLLGVIFDDDLHWRFGRDNTIPIVSKLANPIIKKLIIELVSKCLGDSDSGGAPA